MKNCCSDTPRLIWYLSLALAVSVVVQTALAQATVTLNGNTYTLQPHPRVWLDGPSGALSAALRDTSNRAQASNPAYQAMVTNVNAFVATNVCSTSANTYSGITCPGVGAAGSLTGSGFYMAYAAQAAMLWWAQGANVSDPKGYLAAAKYGIDHIEDIMPGGFACDETTNYCNRNLYDIFNPMLYTYVLQAYSIVRSQMNAAEISAFAGKILNDNDSSHNGINSSACTKQTFSTGAGTISVSGNVVTGSGTNFTSSLSVGSTIFAEPNAPWQPSTMYMAGACVVDSNNRNQCTRAGGTSGGSASSWNTTTGGTTSDGTVAWINSGPTFSTTVGTVYSITSDTQLILTTATQDQSAVSGNAWRSSPAWTTGNCGLIWYVKHHENAPHLIAAQASNYSTDYLTTGGINQSPGNNITLMELKFDILAGLALADDDSRAGTLLTEAYNYFYNQGYPQYKQAFSGPHNFGGEAYGLGTWNGVYETVVAVRNSVVSGPDLTGGYWLSRAAPYMYMYQLAGQASAHSILPWGDGYGGSGALGSPATLVPAMTGCYISSGPTGTLTSECQGFYNYLRNIRGDYSFAGWDQNSGQVLPQLYAFYNYNGTATAPSQNQYIFKDHDITYAQCVATWSSSVCIPNGYMGNAMSWSDQTSTATQMLIKAQWYAGIDHLVNGQAGAFNIWRGGAFLLSGDASSGSDGYVYSCQQQFEILIDLNCNYTAPQYAPFSRWASADPTGDPLNRYVYTMIDLTNTYASAGNATRVQRHIAHFKKAGAQDYIVNYDDIALSSPIAVAPKAYFHYFLNGVAPGTAISYNGTSMTISNTQANSKLNSAFLPVAGLNTAALVVDNSTGTYAGGNGYTFRAYMCPSSNGSTCDATRTAGEWIGVFQPVNGTGGSMPALTQLSAANFRVVQIADASAPKVVAFAQGGNTYSGLTFTSTHSGTAQYLIAGLTPGSYTITGGTASPSSATVNSGDNTLYFEAPAGTYTITNTLAPSAGPCDLNADGAVNSLDVQIAIAQSLGTQACTNADLQVAGVCNVIDVQRVVTASLGGSCKVGP